MARSGIVLGSQTYSPPAVLAYFCPGAGLVTGFPCGSVGTQAGSDLVANGLAADGLPFRPTVFTPATKPVSSGLDGPRLDAPLLLASYPVPALDGRGWKYRGSGLPLASVNSCPSSDEPASLPFRWLSEPFACWWKNNCHRPVTPKG